MEKTKVIFRKYEGGGIIAIFPEELGTLDYYTCSSYMHVGQHGVCVPHGVTLNTKPATPEEYKDLKEELEDRGYKLQVIKRNRQAYQDLREKKTTQLISSEKRGPR